jgi:hypothetical protein
LMYPHLRTHSMRHSGSVITERTASGSSQRYGRATSSLLIRRTDRNTCPHSKLDRARATIPAANNNKARRTRHALSFAV